MRVNAKYKDYSFDKDGNIELTFTIDSRFIEQVVELEQTHEDKYFELVTRDKVAQKTERQNNAVWKLIRMIVEKQDGTSNKITVEELYKQLIVMSNIKVDYLQGLPAIKEQLGTFYRVVDIRERRTSEKGVETCIFECYRGISQFNKEEMNTFIENILYYSNQVGLPVTLESDYLRSLLK